MNYNLTTCFFLFFIFSCFLSACNTNKQASIIQKKLYETINNSNNDHFVKRSLQEIRELIKDDIILAKSLLLELDHNIFSNNMIAEYIILRATIDVHEKKYNSALIWLNNPKIKFTQEVNSIRHIHLLKAISYVNLHDYTAAFAEWFHGSMLKSDAYETNMELFWDTLLNTPKTKIKEQLKKTQQPITTSLLELALIFKDNLQDKSNKHEVSIKLLHKWKTKWENYASIKYYPTNNEDLLANVFFEIAVLLPLSGALEAAGRDIQQGIIASYFYNKKHYNLKDITLKFYDTNNQDINDIIRQAKAKGANFIIGPLNKNLLQQLTTDSLSQATFLTLNYFSEEDILKTINNDIEGSSNKIYQFGLSVKDEVRELTSYARSKGYNRAIILVPNSSQGKKTGDLYNKFWNALNGEVIEYIEYPNNANFTKLFGNLMHVDDSNKRINTIKQILDTEVDSKPSIRNDADVLFLMASPEEARQIKPALSYQFSKNMPVFATSYTYTKAPSVSSDIDLDGIYIPALPWQENSFKSDLKNQVLNFNKQKNQNKSLFALGIDSYNLFTQINKLHFFNKSIFNGLTGNLTINTQLKIKRQLKILQFKNGKLIICK